MYYKALYIYTTLYLVMKLKQTKTNPKVQIAAWVRRETCERLIRLAEEENRSLSNFLNAKLEEIVKGAA